MSGVPPKQTKLASIGGEMMNPDVANQKKPRTLTVKELRKSNLNF